MKDQFQRVVDAEIRLRKQYYRLEMQSGGDILEHIQKLCELHNEMKEIGEPADERDLAMALLASLPFERYQSLIVSLDVAGKDNINFNNLKTVLLIRLPPKNKPIYCIGEGSIRKVKLEGSQVLIDLEKVLCVPDIADDWLSVHLMTMHTANVIFNSGTCKISAGNKVLGVGHRYEQL